MPQRRATDRHGPRSRNRWFALMASPASLRAVTWEDQRLQFLSRYVFSLLGLVYFNLVGVVARSHEYLVAANTVIGVYLVLVTIYMVHARRSRLSPLRWRLTMWTDLVGVAFCGLADASVTSPAFLVFLAIILGNGMRYGLRPFTEAALGSFLMVVLTLYLRFTDMFNTVSLASIFFLLFGGILVLYAYSLMARVEWHREQMAARSNLDLLTGLCNRRGLEEGTTVLFRDLSTHRRPLSVLFADLDGFKAINDSLGHHVGDAVLRKVAGLINATIRATDVAARYGGDEFVVVMPDTTMAQAMKVAARLQEAVAQWARSGDVSLSLSIGMGEAPAHGHELGDLLRRVDGAMYLNKQTNNRGGIRCVDDVPA